MEAETLLEPIAVDWKMELVGMFEATSQQVDHLIHFAAGIKYVLQNAVSLQIESNIYEELEGFDFSGLVKGNQFQSFAARFEQIKYKDPDISKRRVERLVGAKVLEIVNAKVDLTEPETTLKVIHFDGQVILGWLYAMPDFEEIAQRSPKESPFFGGGAMKPMMSKLLVNLIHPFEPVILDPFCGHGGIIREATAVGCYSVGIEINYKIAREARVNNMFLQEEMTEVITGDAIHPPFRRNGILQVVTDPPYAKQSTTIGRDRSYLVETWLERSTQTKVIMTLPEDMELNIPHRWNVTFSCVDYVHKTLTRVIRKLEARL